MSSHGSILSIGNFDGVHLGHQALLGCARDLAEKKGGARVLVMSFEEHPLTVLRPESAPPRLTMKEEREELLLKAGADEVYWLKAELPLLQMSAEAFLGLMIREHGPVLGMVEGADFRFGQGRKGDLAFLKEQGISEGFELGDLSDVTVTLRDKQNVRVSSTLLRWLLSQGRIFDVNLCLGRAYRLPGTVVTGEQRGRTIGFPTANLDPGPVMVPADGVYATTVEIEGHSYLGATSIGVKPTFRGRERVCETHILNYEGDLYGRELVFHFQRWIRDQRPFHGIQQLVDQIHRDIDEIKRLHDWDGLGLSSHIIHH